MNIQQFKYILAVAKFKHFETAAESCFVTQSTLSTMISKLESEIGIQVFDRKTKPVSLTKEGEQIISQLKIITREIDRFIELTQELKGEVSETLRIACIPTVAPYLLPLFLQNFSKKHPDLLIEIKEATTEEIIHLLKTRNLDIGIISSPISDKELIEYPLYNEPFVLYNTNSKNSEKVKLSEVTWENFWLLEEGHCMSDQVIEICNLPPTEISSQPNLLFKAGSIDSLIRFVKTYKGKTLLPYLATLDMEEKEHQFLSYFKNPAPTRTIALLVHRHFTKKKTLNQIKKSILNGVKNIPNINLKE